MDGWRVAMCGQAGSKYASPMGSHFPCHVPRLSSGFASVRKWKGAKGPPAFSGLPLVRVSEVRMEWNENGWRRCLEKCPARLQREGKYGRTLRGSRRQRLIKALGSARTYSVPLVPKRGDGMEWAPYPFSSTHPFIASIH